MLISAKMIKLSKRNLQYLSDHQFYTPCVNILRQPMVGTKLLFTKWQFRTYHRLAQVTSKWRHVRATLVQNKGLQELLSWTQFLSFNQFLYKKWRTIDKPTELLSRFSNFWRKTTTLQIFKKMIEFFRKCFYFVEEKTEHMLENPSKWTSIENFSLICQKKGWLIRHFVLLYTGYGKMLIIQMHIWACYGRRITK